MSTVTGVQSSTQTSQTNSTSSSKNAAAQNMLDYSAFLNLLLAQLKNQDPTKPMDSTEYMSQLASFSNVEQSVKMNAKLDSILTSQSIAQAENLVGKNISNLDGTISGVVESVRVTSTGSIATLKGGKTIDLSAGINVLSPTTTTTTTTKSS